MRFQLRLVAALWVASLVVIGVFAYLQVNEERQRLINELDRRAALVSESLGGPGAGLARGATGPIDRLIKNFASRPYLACLRPGRSMISLTRSGAR